MLAVRSLALLLSLNACGFSLSTGSSIDAGPGDGSSDDAADAAIEDAPIDAPIDMMPEPTWSTPQLVLGITAGADAPTLTADLLDIYYHRNGDIYHSTRPNIFAAFGAESVVVEVSTNGIESSPEISADGTSMTFARLVGNNDIYISTWDGNANIWTPPVPLTELNGTDHDQAATISEDRTMLAMTSHRNGPQTSSDIFFSTRTSPSNPWSPPVVDTVLNSNQQEGSVFLSTNKLMVCFDSNRSGAHDIYCATRSSPTQPFGTPTAIAGVNSSASDQHPWLTADGKLLVFWSDRDGSGRLYFSARL